jgi:RimJ/RimL family protein N-acetyltransferase
MAHRGLGAKIEAEPMMFNPFTLSGKTVQLDPLTFEHVTALAGVGLEPELWRLQPRAISSVEDMRDYVATALSDQRHGTSVPFVIVHRATEQVIGSTRYMDMAPQHRRLEIGATWLAPAYQRTGANTEAKLLLLTHAFEFMKILRVVFKTELLNTQSRKALERLGAVEEGIFRKHLIAVSGRPRDMVYFSILDSEWPTVKTGLENRLRGRAWGYEA